MGDSDDEALCVASFFNRRYLKPDLRTVFPAGFNSYQVTHQTSRPASTKLMIKGVSPPKPGSKMGTTTTPGNDGIPPTRESFMAWARGELTIDDELDDAERDRDGLDPFSDVAGPYFHTILANNGSSKRPQNMNPNASTASDGLTDTLNTMNSKLSIHTTSAPAPPNVYNKELIMSELSLSVRAKHSKRVSQQNSLKNPSSAPAARERIFNAPSALPGLVPSLSMHSTAYEKAPPYQHQHQHQHQHQNQQAPSSTGGLSQGSITSLRTNHHKQLNYEEWMEEQRQLRGKSTISSPASTTMLPPRQEGLNDDGNSITSAGGGGGEEKSVVITMHLGGGLETEVEAEAQTQLATAPRTRSNRSPSKVKAVPLREQRDRFVTIPPPAAGLEASSLMGMAIDSQTSVVSDLLASYDPINMHAARSFPLEIHHFKDMLLSTNVKQPQCRPCRIDVIEAGCTLSQLVALLHTVIHVGASATATTPAAAAAAATANSATTVASSSSSSSSHPHPKKKTATSQDPMIFYYRPPYNDWRPIRHTLDWDQAKSLVTLPLAAARSLSLPTPAVTRQTGLKIMFTMNIEADLDYIQQQAQIGTDPALLTSRAKQVLRTSSTVSPLQTLESATGGAGDSSNPHTTETYTDESGGGANGNANTSSESRTGSAGGEDTTARMIMKILEAQVEGGGFSPTPPSHKFQQQRETNTGGSKVLTSTTTAAIAAAASSGTVRRHGASSEAAQTRSYTSASANVLELPELASSRHSHGARSTTSSSSQSSSSSSSSAAKMRQADAHPPKKVALLKVTPMVPKQPTLAKQEEMARHLEQGLLKTRF